MPILRKKKGLTQSSQKKERVSQRKKTFDLCETPLNSESSVLKF